MKKNPSFRWIWRVIYPILTYLGIYNLIYILAGVLGMAASVVAYEQGGGGGALDYYTIVDLTMLWVSEYSSEITAVSSLLSLPVMLLYMRIDRNRLFLTGEEKYDRVGAGYYLVVLLLGAFSCLAVNSLMYMSGLMSAYSENLEEVSSVLYTGQLAVELLGIGILSPIVEEIIYRGLVMNRMGEVMGETMSLILSAAFFALMHGNLLQMVYTFVLGLIFGYVYRKYHSLLAPILCHCGANLVSVVGSETDLLTRFFAGDSTILISTAVWCVLAVVCLYLIQYRVSPARLHRNGV